MKRARTVAADFAPQPGMPGKAIGRVAHEGEPIGDRRGAHTVLLHHGLLIDDELAAPVPAHDSLAADQLRQILVRRTDDDLAHGFVGREAFGGRGDRIIGLELHHRPDHNAEGGRGLLRQRELSSSDAGSIPSPVL